MNVSTDEPNSSPVAVSGLHAVDNPSPGVAVARCLRRAGRRVVGLCYEPTDTGAYVAEIFECVYRMPKPETAPSVYLERLRLVLSECGATLFIPTLDPEIAFFSTYRSWFDEVGIRCLVPEPRVMSRVAKCSIAEAGQKAGFRVPRMHVVESVKQALAVAREIGTPLMIKGAFYEAHRIDHLDEIPVFFRKLRLRWGTPVLLQAHTRGSEAVIACLCDKPGQLARTICLRKFGMSEQGTTWCGVTFRNEALLEACRELMATLDWVGPCEVEVRMDEQTGMMTLLEVNTRFPSWIGIGPDVNSNLPRDLVSLLEGQAIGPDPGFRTGLVMVRQHDDRTIPLTQFIDLAAGRKVHG
jgi:carbamoyl-phosphate synthase large subunit